MYTVWTLLVLGCFPYSIERSKTQAECAFSVKALFWSLQVRLSHNGYYRWVLAVPLIEKLQGIVWAVVGQLSRGTSLQEGEMKRKIYHRNCSKSGLFDNVGYFFFDGVDRYPPREPNDRVLFLSLILHHRACGRIIFAFSDIRAQVIAAPGGVLGVLILLLFFTPVLCWLVSLRYATRVFMPRVQPGVDLNEFSAGAWQKIKDEYGRVNEEKLHWLECSHRWLVRSFVLVLIVVVVVVMVFALFPAAPTEPTRIIIVTPTPAVGPTPTP